jgi:benzoate-CoA ligase family protein
MTVEGTVRPAVSFPELPERYNAGQLLDANLEAGRGDKIAIWCGDEEVTYGRLFQAVCGLGRALRALGIRREERILIALDDSPAFVTAFLGAIRIGAVPVLVNPLYGAEDLAYFIDNSGARAAVVGLGAVDEVRAALRGHGERVTVLTVGGAAPDTMNFDQLVAAHAGELDPAPTHKHDPAFWLHSSGSTGRPKAVVHLQHAMPYAAWACATNLGMTENDVTFSTSKLSHAYGLGNSLTLPCWAGASTVLSSGRPSPPAVLATIARRRPSIFFSVPTFYKAILDWAESATRNLSSIRVCFSAAEPLPAAIWDRWKDVFGLTILDGVGSTEMLREYCANTLTELRPGSNGRPVPGYELLLVDEAGQPVPRGEVGNLYVKGGSMFTYYWRQPEKTRQSLMGEWFRTGDRYRIDAEGFYWFQGRSDDMIKVGGSWVSPVDVEGILLEHPAVLEAAVIGTEVDGLTKVAAFLRVSGSSRPGTELADELRRWCTDRFNHYQYRHLIDYPHQIVFVEELPKTLTGKIDRPKLRAGATGNTPAPLLPS